MTRYRSMNSIIADCARYNYKAERMARQGEKNFTSYSFAGELYPHHAHESSFSDLGLFLLRRFFDEDTITYLEQRLTH